VHPLGILACVLLTAPLLLPAASSQAAAVLDVPPAPSSGYVGAVVASTKMIAIAHASGAVTDAGEVSAKIACSNSAAIACTLLVFGPGPRGPCGTLVGEAQGRFNAREIVTVPIADEHWRGRGHTDFCVVVGLTGFVGGAQTTLRVQEL